MDPTANLHNQLKLANNILTIFDHVNEDGQLSTAQHDAVAENAYDLAECVLALNTWIKNTHTLPQQWS